METGTWFWGLMLTVGTFSQQQTVLAVNHSALSYAHYPLCSIISEWEHNLQKLTFCSNVSDPKVVMGS